MYIVYSVEPGVYGICEAEVKPVYEAAKAVPDDRLYAVTPYIEVAELLVTKLNEKKPRT